MFTESLKSPMLDLYYLATLPHRQQAALQREQSKQVPVMVLFYHRVADDHPNDWTISNSRFQEQIRWVQQRFDVVSLTEAQLRIGSEENTRPTACITFDDGYADNCNRAIPWLLEENIPFTYFVTSGHVESGEPFQHDIANNCPLAPNSCEQIQQLAQAGVEIGAHTRTHADLGKLTTTAQLREEILGSKRDLEAMIDKPVRYFACPFGLPDNMPTEAFRIAFQAGLWGVCSAYGGYNLPGDDSFHLQRIHADPQWSRFRNWLTVDPRKLRQAKIFNPGDYRNRF